MYNVLGINALTVWDLAQGHSTIANNGVKNTLHMVSKVLDSNNKDMYNAPSNGTKVFDANDCALVQKAMQGTTTYGTAAGTSSMLGRPVAGKSGTANDEMASSFVGYTPSMMNVWAIWNPDDKGNPQVVPAFSGYGVSSTGYPAHLFQEFMAQALQGTEAEQFPTAKDNGKIGGSDGTWGLGKGQSSGLSNNTNKQSTEDAQKQAEQDAQQKAAEEEARSNSRLRSSPSSASPIRAIPPSARIIPAPLPAEMATPATIPAVTTGTIPATIMVIPEAPAGTPAPTASLSSK